MFDILVVCYLFLGGAGSGALISLSFLELLQASRGSIESKEKKNATLSFPKDFYRRCWPLCFIILSFGMLCLALDLGRFDRILNLLTSPTPSAITFGAYSLIAALICAGVFSVLRLFEDISVSRVLIKVTSVVGIISGIAAALYTGILLASMASVLFWQCPLLPVLFFLSSLSTGIACLFLGAVFTETRQSFVKALTILARIDALLIVAELMCLVAYLVLAHINFQTVEPVLALVTGDLSWWFWIGLVVCGLILPLILEQNISLRNYRTQLIWISLLVLVGGLVLRYCMVEVGSFDITQTPNLIYRLG